MEGKKKYQILIVILIVILSVIFTATAYTSYYKVMNYGDTQYESDYYKNLENNYNTLLSEYNNFYNNYNKTVTQYNELLLEYEDLKTDNNKITYVYKTEDAPSTLIKNGTIYWNFNKVDNSLSTWNVPVETYRYYINRNKPNDKIKLNNDGETITTWDLREYIQPEFFLNVTDSLTEGKTDKQFVNEVINLKNQLITYGSFLEGEYKWSMETLTEGQGNCGDTCILVGSLLMAGEEKMDYGLKISLWYCDANNMTNPETVNHVIIGVEYDNGEVNLIETTSDYLYLYGEIKGWEYEI